MKVIEFLNDNLIVPILLLPFILFIFLNLKDIIYFVGLVYMIIVGIIILTILINILKTRYNKHLIVKQINNNTNCSTTAIIIANMDWWDVHNWWLSPYNYDFKTFFKYLDLKEDKYSVFTNLTLKQFDSIIKNPQYKNLYLFGHGLKHAFDLDKNIRVYYCRYSDKNIVKDFVAQYHCNHKGGQSLADYIVPNKKKRKNCDISDTSTIVCCINTKIKRMYKELKKQKYKENK